MQGISSARWALPDLGQDLVDENQQTKNTLEQSYNMFIVVFIMVI